MNENILNFRKEVENLSYHELEKKRKQIKQRLLNMCKMSDEEVEELVIKSDIVDELMRNYAAERK